MVDVVGDDAFTAGEAAGGTASLIFRVASLSSTHAGTGRNKLFIRAIADSGVAGPTQATTGQYLGDMRLNYAAPDRTRGYTTCRAWRGLQRHQARPQARVLCAAPCASAPLRPTSLPPAG